MKAIFKSFLCLGALLCACSCAKVSTPESDDNLSVDNKVKLEMDMLSCEDELNQLTVRGDDDIVDWQLSKEFAQLWMEDGIIHGDYPVNACLWDIPVAVYNTDGEIQYYEFRVVSEGKTVGAIAGAARKDMGCPVAFESLTDGYYDEISALYEQGKLSADDLPRIVDNGYPSYVVGVLSQTKGTDGTFTELLDPVTGAMVNEGDLTPARTYSEVADNYPECIPEEIDREKMEALISDYNKLGEDFWKAAVENKGHIADFAVRGGSKNPRTSISGIDSVRAYENHGHSTDSVAPTCANCGPCGAVAAAFVLDYLHKNRESLAEWDSITATTLDYSPLENALRDVMNFTDWSNGQSSCWPNGIRKAIKHYSDYCMPISGYSIPKDAINDDLPGISLRVFGTGFAHYRPIVAYQQNGWGPFSWSKMKVLDLVDASDKVYGSWETFIPVHHLSCWNIAED